MTNCTTASATRSASFPTGVAVVTAEGPAGLTTNAVTSLSLDPVLLLVCFDNDSRTLPFVRQSRRFAVNLLRAGQEDLARVFASKAVAEEKFAAVDAPSSRTARRCSRACSRGSSATSRTWCPAATTRSGSARCASSTSTPTASRSSFFRGRYQ